MNTKYKTADEDAISELPRSLKALKAMVFILLLTSILAMISLIWAAYHIATKPNSPLLPEKILLPENAKILSFTQLEMGEVIIIYQSSEVEGLIAEYFDASGEPQSRTQLDLMPRQDGHPPVASVGNANNQFE